MKTASALFFIVSILLPEVAKAQETKQEPRLVLPIGHVDKSVLNEGVYSAQFSPDEKQVVTAGADQSAKIWNAADSKLMHTLEGHTDKVTSAEFSPDGKLILTASPDNTAKIWDVASGKLVHSLANPLPVYEAHFSPDGKQVVTSCEIGIFLWEASTGKELQSVGTSCSGAIFNFDGTQVAIWSVLTLKIFDVSRDTLMTLATYKESIQSVQFSPDGKLIASSSRDKTVKTWNTQTGRLVRTFKGKDDMKSVKFSPDGKLIVTASKDFTNVIWNVETGLPLKTLLTNYEAKKAEFSPDGKTVMTVPRASGSHPWLFNASTGESILSLTGHSSIISAAAFSPSGNFIVTSSWDGTAVITDLKQKQYTSLTGRVPKIKSAVLSPDGTVSLEVTNGLAVVRNLSNGLPVYFLSDTLQNSAQFSPDGKLLFTNTYNYLKIWEAATGKLIKEVNHQWGGNVELLFNQAWSRYLTFSNYTDVKLWDGSSHSFIATLEHKSQIRQAEFSKDGNLVATASSDNTAKIWDALTGKLLQTLKHSDWVYSIHLSPDSKLAVTISGGLARIWNVSTGQLIEVMMSDYAVTACAFSQDGKKLAIGSSSQIIIWERPTSTSMLELETVAGPVGYLLQNSLSEIAFSPDGTKITGVYGNGISKIWDAISGKQIYSVKGAIVSVNWKDEIMLINHNSLLSLFDIKNGKTIVSWVNVSGDDWVVTHPSGLFDASPGAMDILYFVQGLEIIDFNQLKERYYEPGLWKKVRAGEEVRNAVGMKSIELPPDIEMGQVDGEGYLPVKLVNRGGGIGEVNLFMNGKEIIKDARDPNTKPDSDSLLFKIFVGKHKNIVKGQENLIAVKAWNKNHWVVSRGAVVSYQSKEIESYKPAVHILSCGVSDYTGTEIDLKYAAKDANDVTVALQLGAKKLFGEDRSYVYSLTTTQPKEFYPTKTNIVKVFEKISSTAHPLDVFVMYVSGHGINFGGQDGDWYYLTQEAYTGSASAYNDPGIRSQTTISSNELVELFKKVPALKQVLILDACASGKVVDNLMAQKDISSSTLRALDRMRDRTGMHIITGCTADAVSYEASKYGQGILTYSLLEGIRGAALRENQYLDVNILFQYAQDRVPTLAKGIGGIQSPQVFSPQGSQSFDIGLLTETEKKDIPITKIKPVYIRSNFQDENDLEDVLGLGRKVDDLLNEASAKGTEAQLIFVDVREYPEGCKLIGRYKKENGKILLKLKKKCEGKETTFDLEGTDINDLSSRILKSLAN